MKPDTLSLLKIYGDVFFCSTEYADSVCNILDRLDLNLHITKFKEIEAGLFSSEEDPNNNVKKGYINSSGVAEISLSGPVTKKPTSMSDIFGGFSTIQASKAISNALKDSSIKSILLKIDSPGGSVSGVQDLADKIYAADKIKPIVCYAEDMCCSAGYWPASQARFLASNETAVLANIGGYTVITDYSKAAEKMGVHVEVIKDGKYKAIGYPGTELTDEQRAEVQRMVSGQVALFTSAVARGRNLSQSKAEKLTDGKAYIGAEAIQHGLLDRVMSYDILLKAMQDGVTDPADLKKFGDNQMSNEQEEKSFFDRMKAHVFGGVSSSQEMPSIAATITVNPLVAKCEELGIKSVEDLEKLNNDAKIAIELSKDLRETAKANAIRAYEQDSEDTKNYLSIINEASTSISVIKTLNKTFESKIASTFSGRQTRTSQSEDGDIALDANTEENSPQAEERSLNESELGQRVLEARKNGQKNPFATV